MKKIIFVTMVFGFLLMFLTTANAQDADVNGDGVVNIFDLTLVASHYGERVDTAQMSNIDVNSDGIVDVQDLVIVANVMGQGEGAHNAHRWHPDFWAWRRFAYPRSSTSP